MRSPITCLFHLHRCIAIIGLNGFDRIGSKMPVIVHPDFQRLCYPVIHMDSLVTCTQRLVDHMSEISETLEFRSHKKCARYCVCVCACVHQHGIKLKLAEIQGMASHF